MEWTFVFERGFAWLSIPSKKLPNSDSSVPRSSQLRLKSPLSCWMIISLEQSQRYALVTGTLFWGVSLSLTVSVRTLKSTIIKYCSVFLKTVEN
jgi:hypothetical protein